ncbi:uncharacterized protein LOC143186256 [Calliopsis andreniformis]|uniref:uncharacterized protein LOC143186256 n=1 Tax=Calliopsis andreniformis TaxID=337506 RepID=UPI003FCD9314
MGNCIKPVDPLIASLPKTIGVDASPIVESQLPIIFIIGGPGAGKRTLCNIVAEKYGFLGIISADIIRHEVSTRTDRAVVLARLMSQGRLVPSDVLIELITVKMLDHLKNTKGFIIAGFPRHVDQSKLFDAEIRPPDLVLFLNVRNSVLSDRIMARMITTTERMPYDFDSIKKRIKMFRKKNGPILKYYKKKYYEDQILVVIDGEPELTTVFDSVCTAIDNILPKFPSTSATSTNNDKYKISVAQFMDEVYVRFSDRDSCYVSVSSICLILLWNYFVHVIDLWINQLISYQVVFHERILKNVSTVYNKYEISFLHNSANGQAITTKLIVRNNWQTNCRLHIFPVYIRKLFLMDAHSLCVCVRVPPFILRYGWLLLFMNPRTQTEPVCPCLCINVTHPLPLRARTFHDVHLHSYPWMTDRMCSGVVMPRMDVELPKPGVKLTPQSGKGLVRNYGY